MNIKSEIINESQSCDLKLGNGLPPFILNAWIIFKSMRIRATALQIAVIGAITVGSFFCDRTVANASTKQPVADSQSSIAGAVVSGATPQVDHSNLASVFKQAVADDAAGRHEQARKWYDALEGADLNFSVAVPSAVNLAVLGRYDDAKKAFAKIERSDDERAASYAKLWQLWLTARTFTGKPAALQKELKKMASDTSPSAAYQRKLISVFAGEGEVAEVFTMINKTVVEGLPARDARSEAAFFGGGYLQYVRKDIKSALRVYLRELPQTEASVEKPLIEQAINSI